jgi:hypothetical protein
LTRNDINGAIAGFTFALPSTVLNLEFGSYLDFVIWHSWWGAILRAVLHSYYSWVIDAYGSCAIINTIQL